MPPKVLGGNHTARELRSGYTPAARGSPAYAMMNSEDAGDGGSEDGGAARPLSPAAMLHGHQTPQQGADDGSIAINFKGVSGAFSAALFAPRTALNLDAAHWRAATGCFLRETRTDPCTADSQRRSDCVCQRETFFHTLETAMRPGVFLADTLSRYADPVWREEELVELRPVIAIVQQSASRVS